MFKFLQRQHFTHEKGRLRFLRRWVVVWLIMGLAGLFATYKLLDRYVDRLVADVLTDLIVQETGSLYNVSFGDIRLNFLKKELSIFDFSIDPKEENIDHLAASRRNIYHVHLPKFQLTLGSVWKLVLWRELEVTGVMMQRPFINMDNFPGDRPLTLSRETGNLYGLISRYLEMFKLSHFAIQDASFCLTNHLKSGDWTQTFRHVSFSMKNFLVDEKAAADTTKLFYTDAFQLSIKDQEIYLSDSLHVFTFDRLAINTDSAQIVFKNFHLYPRGGRNIRYLHPDKSIFDIRVPELTLKGVDFTRAYNDNVLIIKTIKMVHPNIFVNQVKADRSVKDQKVVSAVPAALSALFSRISVHDFRLTDAAFNLEKSLQPQIKVEQVDLQLLDFKLDSTGYDGWNTLPTYRDFDLRVKNQTFYLIDSAYTLRLDEFTLSSLQAKLGARGISIRSNEPGRQVWPIRRLTVDKVDLTFVDLRQALDNGAWKIRSLEIDGVEADLVPPTGRPRPPNLSGPANPPADSVLSEFLASIDAHSLSVSRANVHYLNPKTGDSLSLTNASIGFQDVQWQAGQKWDDLPQQVVSHLSAAQFIQFHLHWPSGGQSLTGSSFDWSATTGRATGQNIHLRPVALGTGRFPMQISADLPKVAITGIDLAQIVKGGHLHFASFSCARPDITIHQSSTSNPVTKARASNVPAKWALQSLDGQDFRLNRGKFRLIHNQRTLIAIDNLTATVPLWECKAFSAASVWEMGLRTEGAEITLGRFQFRTANDRLKMAAKGAAYFQVQGQAWINEGQLQGPLDLRFATAKATGLDLAGFWAGKPLTMAHFELGQAHLAHHWQDKSLIISKLNLSLGSVAISPGDHAKELLRQTLQHPIDLQFAEAVFTDSLRSIALGNTHMKSEPSGPGQAIWASDLVYAHRVSQAASTIHVPALSVRRFQLLALLDQRELLMDSLHVAGPMGQLNLQHLPVSLSRPDKDSTASREPQPSQRDLKRVAVKSLRLTNGALTGQLLSKGLPFLHSIPSLSLQAEQLNLTWDAAGRAHMTGEWQLHTGRQVLVLPNVDNCAEIEACDYASTPSELKLSEVRFQPVENEPEHASSSVRQRDYIRFHSQTLRFRQPDWSALLAGQGLRLTHLIADSIYIEIFRDKRSRKISLQAKQLPLMALQQLAFPITIDTVEAHWGTVLYREHPAKAPRGVEARVGLTGINGTLYHLTNRPVESKPRFALLNLRGRLMDEANIALSVKFDLTSPNGAHEIEASGSDLILDRLNPVLEPTARVKVESGEMLNFEMNAQADSSYATGKMYFYYKDLKFSFVDRKKQDAKSLKSRLTALLANMLIRNRNVKSMLSNGKRGTIFYERQINKSIFSYWSRILFSGIVSSVTGIQKDLQNQIRQQEQEAQRELRQSARQEQREDRRVRPKTGKFIDETEPVPKNRKY